MWRHVICRANLRQQSLGSGLQTPLLRRQQFWGMADDIIAVHQDHSRPHLALQVASLAQLDIPYILRETRSWVTPDHIKPYQCGNRLSRKSTKPEMIA